MSTVALVTVRSQRTKALVSRMTQTSEHGRQPLECDHLSGRGAPCLYDAGSVTQAGDLEAVAFIFPARLRVGRIGQSAEQQSGMGSPYKSFGDDGVAFIVDLEPAVVHQP